MDEKTIARFWSKVEKTDSCWLWTGAKMGDGYGNLTFLNKQHLAHRFSWLLAHGEWPPVGACVCHSCDVRACVNPAHLWIGTNAENVEDREAKRRGRTAKLSDAQVIEALGLIRAGGNHRIIAERFGVSRAAISLMAEGRTWKRFQ